MKKKTVTKLIYYTEVQRTYQKTYQVSRKLGLRCMGNDKTTLTDLFPKKNRRWIRWKNNQKLSSGKVKISEFVMNVIQEHAALENC